MPPTELMKPHVDPNPFHLLLLCGLSHHKAEPMTQELSDARQRSLNPHTKRTSLLSILLHEYTYNCSPRPSSTFVVHIISFLSENYLHEIPDSLVVMPPPNASSIPTPR